MVGQERASSLIDGGEALLAALIAQDELYTSMLGICRREEDAIVSADVATLTALTEEKEQLIEHLNALETERMTALVAIAAATDDLDAGTATLTQLEAVLPPSRPGV
ncbi:MAG: hypothetical protein GEU80_04200 [Dehalococcoidia bacterium]|nr:hypothetical protein [Dehalococcoidia bacterium]